MQGFWIPGNAEKAKQNNSLGADMTNAGCQMSDKAIAPIDTKKEK